VAVIFLPEFLGFELAGFERIAMMPQVGEANSVMPGFMPRLSGLILVDEVHGMDSSVF
jgi:hypothetical protein